MCEPLRSTPRTHNVAQIEKTMPPVLERLTKSSSCGVGGHVYGMQKFSGGLGRGQKGEERDARGEFQILDHDHLEDRLPI